jgi:Lrp/AsnC family transcriptional regulator, regulator for asnA, asnC and gidA
MTERAQIDELDMRIISALQVNGRVTNIEMSRSLGVSEATIRNRVSRLLDEDLINITAVPTPRAVGMTLSAIIGVAVQLPQLDHVVERLASKPEARYVGVSTGRFDIIVEAFFLDQDHLLRFVTNDVGELDGVARVETSLILKVAKFSYEWEVPPSALKGRGK